MPVAVREEPSDSGPYRQVGPRSAYVRACRVRYQREPDDDGRGRQTTKTTVYRFADDCTEFARGLHGVFATNRASGHRRQNCYGFCTPAGADAGPG